MWESEGSGHDRRVPRKSRLVSGVKGYNLNETSPPGSPALWARSFIYPLEIIPRGFASGSWFESFRNF